MSAYNHGTAYLCGSLDITTSPPKLVGIGIYSEPPKSLTHAIHKQRYVLFTEYNHEPTFGENANKLRDHIHEMLKQNNYYKWIVDVPGFDSL